MDMDDVIAIVLQGCGITVESMQNSSKIIENLKNQKNLFEAVKEFLASDIDVQQAFAYGLELGVFLAQQEGKKERR